MHYSDDLLDSSPPASLTDAIARSQDDDLSAYSEDLGDRADEYSRRLSSVPLNGGSVRDSSPQDHRTRQYDNATDDSSVETLVHPNTTPLAQHPPSPSTRRVSGAPAVQDVASSNNPFASSPRETYQARTTRMSFPTPELGYEDYWEGDVRQPESPPNFPRALRATAREASWVSEPQGDGIGQLKRRRTLSSGDSDSELYLDRDEREEDYDFYGDILEKHHGLDLRTSGYDDNSSSSLQEERDGHVAYTSALDKLHHWNDDSSSANTNDEVIMDPDDPRVTGAKPNHLEEKALEKEMLSKMDYRTRRKHLQRMRIEYNIACEWSITLASSVAC